ANMGTPAECIARATYSLNFFQAGGFGLGNNDGVKDPEAAAAAPPKRGAQIAVICSTHQKDQTLVEATAPRPQAARAPTVVPPAPGRWSWRGTPRPTRRSTGRPAWTASSSSAATFWARFTSCSGRRESCHEYRSEFQGRRLGGRPPIFRPTGRLAGRGRQTAG